jgi:hypothetical protein
VSSRQRRAKKKPSPLESLSFTPLLRLVVATTLPLQPGTPSGSGVSAPTTEATVIMTMATAAPTTPHVHLAFAGSEAVVARAVAGVSIGESPPFDNYALVSIGTSSGSPLRLRKSFGLDRPFCGLQAIRLRGLAGSVADITETSDDIAS